MHKILIKITLICILSKQVRTDWRDVLPIDDLTINWNGEYFNQPLINPHHWSFGWWPTYLEQVYGNIIDVKSEHACRLNSDPCRRHSECCSKFCRCTKWSTFGKDLCTRKCL
ncbi:hypothetical protein BpHYR1_021045 [Brachionus plicatilis]|uniref:Uncharacterized protein n=1 Tax=Brachionus plicatilis TaxID=10195 RepID=A0A3M7P3I2_BRAPC|nr:hypothetical protein BpHYR1_021045 [Brachionus plicatilis]